MIPDSGQKDLLLFTINPSSGLVSVSSSLDRLSGRIQHYNVLATDRNGNGLSSTLHLSVLFNYNINLFPSYNSFSFFKKKIRFTSWIAPTRWPSCWLLVTKSWSLNRKILASKCNVTGFLHVKLFYIFSLYTLIYSLVSDVSGMEVWIKSVEPHVFEGDMVDGSMYLLQIFYTWFYVFKSLIYLCSYLGVMSYCTPEITVGSV